jgi:hypothetical protein
MLEYINGRVVRNNTDVANSKEYVLEELAPMKFPAIPISQLNISELGIVTEYLGNIVEDGDYGLMLALNETFINKSILDESIYAKASTYDLGYENAVPSLLPCILEVYIEDIISLAKNYEVIIDRDTKIIINDKIYVIDYDIRIRYRYINGKAQFTSTYILQAPNMLSNVKTQYIKNQVSSNGWLLLYLTVREYNRVVVTQSITDNMIYTAAPIDLPYDDQLAGFDAVYINPKGERTLMQQKYKYAKPQYTPFLYKISKDINTIRCAFSPNKKYWVPEFNSSIEFTIYTTHGKSSNMTISMDIEVAVQRTGERYISNEDLRMVAIPYAGSVGGLDQPDIEMVRWETIEAMNTANVLSTDKDIEIYFRNYSRRYGTLSTFFKRRDDPTGRLFAMFNVINKNKYIYPTLTASIILRQAPDKTGGWNDATIGNQTDNGFTIFAGNLWEYIDAEMPGGSYTLKLKDPGPTKYGLNIKQINDSSQKNLLPQTLEEQQNVWVNPFIMQYNKNPNFVSYYSILLNYQSMSIQKYYNEMVLEHFIINRVDIQRGITDLSYHIKIEMFPVMDDKIFNDYDQEKDFHYDIPQDMNRTWRISFITSGIDPASVTFDTDLTSYIIGLYGLDPELGYTVFNTDTNIDPDRQTKYIFDPKKEWVQILNSTYPLKVIMAISVHAKQEDYTGYVEMTCTKRIDDMSGSLYTYEADMKTLDVIDMDGNIQRVEVAMGSNKHDFKPIQPPAGPIYISATNTEFTFFTLCQKIGENIETIPPDPTNIAEADLSTARVPSWAPGRYVYVPNDSPQQFNLNMSEWFVTQYTAGILNTLKDLATIYDTLTGITYQYYQSLDSWLQIGAPSLFGNPNYRSFNVTDRFVNESAELDLIEPCLQMRSYAFWDGALNNYNIMTNLVPFVRYDCAVDPEQMGYVIKVIREQYKAISELAKDRLEENTGIDFKLYNTSGRSSYFQIGRGEDNPQWINLDRVWLTIDFTLGVITEAEFNLTADEVKRITQEYIQTLNDEKPTDFAVSNLQTLLENSLPNIKHLIFNRINEYPPDYQLIQAIRYIDDMPEEELQRYVPEMLCVSLDNIIIRHGT